MLITNICQRCLLACLGLSQYLLAMRHNNDFTLTLFPFQPHYFFTCLTGLVLGGNGLRRLACTSPKCHSHPLRVNSMPFTSLIPSSKTSDGTFTTENLPWHLAKYHNHSTQNCRQMWSEDQVKMYALDQYKSAISNERLERLCAFLRTLTFRISN